MMTLKKWLEWLKSRVRSFLGINSLATIGDIIILRDDLAKYHNDVLKVLQKPEIRSITSMNQGFNAQTYDWDQVQRIELQNLFSNPEKED